MKPRCPKTPQRAVSDLQGAARAGSLRRRLGRTPGSPSGTRVRSTVTEKDRCALPHEEPHLVLSPREGKTLRCGGNQGTAPLSRKLSPRACRFHPRAAYLTPGLESPAETPGPRTTGRPLGVPRGTASSPCTASSTTPDAHRTGFPFPPLPAPCPANRAPIRARPRRTGSPSLPSRPPPAPLTAPPTRREPTRLGPPLR